MPTNSPPSIRRAAALLFFVSGFCGLLYQLIWMRLAFASFGINTPVMSIVLSVFMAGLSLGSWWGGKLALRWITSSALVPAAFYACAETIVGIGGVTVPLLYTLGAKWLLTFGASDSLSYLLLSSLILLVALLPWCVAMGATFPFMLAFLKKVENAEDGFSFLYTANVLGAMAGVLLTAVILIECLGFHHSLLLAALLNGLIGLASLYLGFRFSNSKTTHNVPSVAAETTSTNQSIWILLFLTGFITMAMEVVWTRDFTPVLQNQVYSYAFLLFAYLLSTFAGALYYRKNIKKKTLSIPLLLQIAFALALIPVVLNDPRLQRSPFIVLLTIVPFCAFLGYLTPRWVDEFSSGSPKKAGQAYALNMLGCILGPLAASYFLLPSMGTKLSLIFLSLLLPLFAFLPAFRSAGKKPTYWGILPGAVLLGLSLLWTIDYEEAFYLFYSPSVIQRDYTATVVACGTGMEKRLYVNGIGMTSLTPATKMMAHLPLAFLPHTPQNALDICFGMGSTFRALSSWNIETTVVDLVPSVPKVFNFYWPDADHYRSLPQNHIVIDDGRRYLNRTHETYDLITIDPPPPMEAAGSSLLYSTDFYELVKKHLKTDGLLQQWMPYSSQKTWQSVARSLAYSFPYVRVFVSPDRMGFHFLASMEPLQRLTASQLSKKMPVAAHKDLAEWYPQLTAEQVFNTLLKNEIPISYFVHTDGLVPLLTDDRPYNEYYLLRTISDRVHF